MIKVTDYIVKRLSEHGIKDVFMISGGGAMHLNDSVGRSNEVKYICNEHEQASAIGAEGYFRASGKLTAVIVTTGPGGTNTITGVIGQWLDSIPVIYISGQVKFETCIDSCREIGLRQLGDQEINIIDIVKPITKYAEMIKDPYDVKKIIDRAVYIAQSGRPGPVWVDVPLNIQGALIDENKLEGYKIDKDKSIYNENDIAMKIDKTLELLKKSKRPAIIAGHGIRLAKAQDVFSELIQKLSIPILSTFNGFDLIESDNPLYIGRIGTIGDRAGNFALQNADLILCIGTRNNIRQVSYGWKTFAKNAVKVVVDIDEKELNKPTVIPDIKICSDARYFIKQLIEKLQHTDIPDFHGWLNWCTERKNRYPVVLKEYKKLDKYVQPYYFMQLLSENLDEDDVIVTGNGTASVTYFQAGIVKKGQRVIWNSGCASMGYDLPAAIGACIGSGNKRTICLAGDGSLQMNIQELETAVYHNLNLRIFVLNNSGYISIKQTQDSYFNSKYTACNEKSGVGIPDFLKIAAAYGLKTEKIDSHHGMEDKLRNILSQEGPVLCEVFLPEDYIFSPKLSSQKLEDGTMVSKPLEDMYPFLERDEFEKNIIKGSDL